MAVKKIKKRGDGVDDFGAWIYEQRKNDPRMKKAIEERDELFAKSGIKPNEIKKNPAKKTAAKKAPAKKKK